MNALDENFQCYVDARTDKIIKKVKKSREWKKVNKEYDKLHDVIYENLSEKEKENFNKFMHSIWIKNDIELSIGYECGLVDGILMKGQVDNNNDSEGETNDK